MNTAAFIARRIAFNRERSFSRFIIRLAIAATVISVGAMILTLAFTNGFQYAISQKVLSFWGHIRVQHYSPNRSSNSEEAPMNKNDTVRHILKSDPGIHTVQAFATKFAVVRSAEGVDEVQMKGVEKDYDFGNLQGFLRSGGWPHFPDSGYSNEIVLSQYTANELKVKVGDKLLIYFIQQARQDSGSPNVRIRPMIVSGLYKTGIEDYDKLIAVCDLRLIQRLNNWSPDQIGGYEVFTRDYRAAERVSARVHEKLPRDWDSRTTQEILPNIFDWLNLQDNTIVIVLVIMIVVATLNLVTCLIILVLERTRMVGLLKAVGSRNVSIQWIFLYQGAFITLFGLVLGNIFGLGICWLQDRYGFITLPEDAYFISKAVVRLEWWHVPMVNLLTFAICILVLLIPTVIIRRVQPARAIQFR